jgi:hypothetical protein
MKMWFQESNLKQHEAVDIRGCASIMLTTFYNLDDPLFLHFYE